MQAQEASRDITSYRFTADGQVQIRENSRAESIEITGNGVVNVEDRRANETIDTRGDTRVGFRERRRAYVDGHTLDVECSRLGWARYNLTESTRWFNYTSLGQQLTLLDRTNVYWNGTETLDGVEMAVVTAHPTKQQIEASQNLPTRSGVTQRGANVQNATIRVWIDTETDRIHKVRRELHVRADGATAVATLTYHFAGYNEPTNISRPTSADPRSKHPEPSGRVAVPARDPHVGSDFRIQIRGNRKLPRCNQYNSEHRRFRIKRSPMTDAEAL